MRPGFLHDRATAKIRLYTAAAATIVCVACSVPVGEPVPPRPPPAPAPPPGATMSAVAGNVIAEINRIRRSNGLDALVEDAALNHAAREHSKEMASRARLDHESNDPALRTLTMRIEAAGGTWMQAAENLAQVFGASSSVPDRTATMWLESDGHRRNMLSPQYTHTGAGVATDSRGYWYITQLYVLPREVR